MNHGRQPWWEHRILTEVKMQPLPPGERLWAVWAVAVLERIGSDDARRLLEELAGGMPEARLTRETGAAAKRRGEQSPAAK
jgi:hypothetical protein